uniref:Uncharacterized protein n=1 Tax=Acrobeloides nanus TaxID=290746 RepID=A0A914EN47_9BILA
MVNLGLIDIGQLLSYYLVFSLMLLTNSNFGDTFSKVSMSLSNATWVGEASMVFRRIKTNKAKVMVSYEWRLFLQAMFICFYKSVISVMWNFYVPTQPIPYFIFICFSLLESGYTPFMYLLVNKSLRGHIIKLVLSNSQTNTLQPFKVIHQVPKANVAWQT